MKTRWKAVLITLAFYWIAGNVQAQDRFVARDTVITFLINVDVDTAYFLLTPAAYPEQIQSDTTKSGVTKYIPAKWIRSSGYFDLWLDRTNQSGAADSFRVYYFPLHPITGALAKNDSTFIIAGASTFANFTSGSRYNITLPTTTGGIGIVIRQGDLTTVKTRIRMVFNYAQ